MISVIVPVHNGSRYIDDFIEGIEKNIIDSKNYEVVFVDDRSTDDTRERLEKIGERLHNIKILCNSEGRGSYSARNRGAAEARGNILSFVDIDCRLDKNYLKNTARLVKKGRAYAGHVEIESGNNSVWEVFDSLVHMDNEENVRKGRIVTANMSISKEVFDSVGEFDEVLSGGDYLYGKRLVEAGVEIIYKPEIKVKHPSRKTYDEIRVKLLRVSYGEGQIAALKKIRPYKGILLQLLRIANLPKHLRVSREIRRRECRGLMEFNFKYFYLKIMQIEAFVRGYREKQN